MNGFRDQLSAIFCRLSAIIDLNVLFTTDEEFAVVPVSQYF